MTMVGVLAIQGDVAEHCHVLRRLGVEAQEVRQPGDLAGLNGLIIPGGESTTIGRVAHRYGLMELIRALIAQGMPVWGTCAGVILLARSVDRLDFPTLGVLDVHVRRNAFGRQVDSFEIDLAVPALDAIATAEERGRPVRAVFIRAPIIDQVGENVDILAKLPDGTVVAVQQGHILGTAFHPELTDDTRFHRYFLRLVEEHAFTAAPEAAV